jgi:hypothetical protein
VFPVGYELNSYVLFRWHSIFKGLIPHSSNICSKLSLSKYSNRQNSRAHKQRVHQTGLHLSSWSREMLRLWSSDMCITYHKLIFIAVGTSIFIGQGSQWKANNRSTGQEVSCILWNSKVHYRVRKGSTIVLVVIHLTRVHILILYLIKINNFRRFSIKIIVK